MLIDGLLVIAAGYVAYYIRWTLSGYLWSMDQMQFLGSILFLMFVNNFLMGQFGFYSDHRLPSFYRVFRRILVVVVLDFALLSIAYFTLNWEEISRLFIVIYAFALFLFLAIERAIFEIFIINRQKKDYHISRILLVGSNERAFRVFKALQNQRSWGHRVIGYLLPTPEDHSVITEIPCLGTLQDLENVLMESTVDDVVFALSEEAQKMNIKTAVETCEILGVTYRIIRSMYNATY